MISHNSDSIAVSTDDKRKKTKIVQIVTEKHFQNVLLWKYRNVFVLFFILFTSVISVEMMQQNKYSYSFDFCGLIFGHDSLANSYSKGFPAGLSEAQNYLVVVVWSDCIQSDITKGKITWRSREYLQRFGKREVTWTLGQSKLSRFHDSAHFESCSSFQTTDLLFALLFWPEPVAHNLLH